MGVNVNPMGDSQVYEEIAHNILNKGTVYSVEGYAIVSLYPFFVAGIFFIFGTSHINIFVIQSILGAMSAALLFLCVRRISTAVAVIASILFGIHPLMLFYSKQVMTESVHIFLAVSLTFLTLKVLEESRVWIAVAIGFLMGLISYAAPKQFSFVE